VAKKPEEKPEGEAPAEDPAGSSRETAVGHQVVDSDATEVFFSRDEPAAAAQPAPEPQPAAAPPTGGGGTSPAAADRKAAEAKDPFVAKPELFVAGAFVGAFVVGKLLKKLTGSDD
jgi:predicted lipid-binding transport protein (Tim44 family)